MFAGEGGYGRSVALYVVGRRVMPEASSETTACRMAKVANSFVFRYIGSCDMKALTFNLSSWYQAQDGS